jgi:hypothetical protein
MTVGNKDWNYQSFQRFVKDNRLRKIDKTEPKTKYIPLRIHFSRSNNSYFSALNSKGGISGKCRKRNFFLNVCLQEVGSRSPKDFHPTVASAVGAKYFSPLLHIRRSAIADTTATAKGFHLTIAYLLIRSF